MRTGGQGQAAVLRERVDRRRASGLPGPGYLGRGRTSHGLSRISGALSRDPRTVYGDIRFAMGAHAYHGFLFAQTGVSP